MAVRTWKKGLYITANAAKHYMTKWNAQLSANLTTDEYAAMQSCLTCLLALLKLLATEG